MQNLKLMMIGETTGNKRSDEEYLPLGTNVERFLWEELDKYHLSRDDFYIYSIFDNKGHKKNEMSKQELIECSIELQKEMLMFEPDLILTVGRLPAEEMLKETLGGKFYSIIGSSLYSKYYERWFVPTIHPSVIARDPDKLMFLEKGIEVFSECIEELLKSKYEH